MKLKSLELSGFKSFAKTTVLEFPMPVVSIVGPNGSGKSNIAEAIRWVLGEQSMKSLRGKRGEDLIFAGTPKSSALGKASVVLHFDNKDKKIPLEFDTVSLGRKIFRDGLNEYYLNGSQVRLRDIVELLAKMGLGETKHNIIGQGEVDRILLASSRERRSMLEEALGLRVYQLKKKEALRKLEETERNLHEVEGLVKEIGPHLKYLRNLKEKADQRGTYEKELKDLYIAYFSDRTDILKNSLQKSQTEEDALQEFLKKVEGAIISLQKDVETKEKITGAFGAIQEFESSIQELDEKRRTYERELGRLEGKIEIEVERSQKPIERIVDMAYVRGEIERWHNAVKALLKDERIDFIKQSLQDIDHGFSGLLTHIMKGKIMEEPKPSPLLHEFEKEKEKFSGLIQDISRESDGMREKLQKEEERYRTVQQEIRNLDRAVREKEEERSDLRVRRERIRLEREQLEKEKSTLVFEMESARVSEKELLSPEGGVFGPMNADELKKKIEKIKIRLEEIGGIDQQTIDEYNATEARYQFLSKELEDITKAKDDLYSLIKNLEETIERDFEEGFKKIQHEFEHYFKIIFGGGKAILRHEVVKKELDENSSSFAEASEDEEEIEEKKSFGIEIDVDLPRKRIKSMAMLSGGERALTAIALLFAISAVNPPPFLVLDETDAALDEANSKLYAETLKDLSKKTDLVIVTHNRETMKQADVLYGVTMGDDGISKLLSIKLEDAGKYANR